MARRAVVMALLSLGAVVCDGRSDEERWRACLAEEEAKRDPELTAGQVCCMRVDVPHEGHCL